MNFKSELFCCGKNCLGPLKNSEPTTMSRVRASSRSRAGTGGSGGGGGGGGGGTGGGGGGVGSTGDRESKASMYGTALAATAALESMIANQRRFTNTAAKSRRYSAEELRLQLGGTTMFVRKLSCLCLMT